MGLFVYRCDGEKVLAWISRDDREQRWIKWWVWIAQSIWKREGKIETRKMMGLGRDGNYRVLVQMGHEELICSNGYDLAKVMVTCFVR